MQDFKSIFDGFRTLSIKGFSIEDYISIRAILKYATSHNHPQPATTSHNQPQLPTTIYNQPQPATTSHNHQKITQKSHNLLQIVMLLHLDVNTETEVDFDSGMKQ